MEQASEALFVLEPVTFRYKKEIDPANTRQFGLVAEQVEKVDPDLVVHDKEGKPYTVRYDAVNAMLLNEFLKEHRRGEESGGASASHGTGILAWRGAEKGRSTPDSEFPGAFQGTSFARKARTGIVNRAALTAASHEVWMRICTPSGPLAIPRVISTRW